MNVKWTVPDSVAKVALREISLVPPGGRYYSGDISFHLDYNTNLSAQPKSDGKHTW